MAGRPQFQPTEKQGEQVAVLAGLGLPQTEIASIMKISVDTLTKYYEQQLLDGVAHANEKVAKFLHAQAQTNLTAAIFWMKCRAGWRETDKMSLEVPGNSKVEMVINFGKAPAEKK